MSVNVVNNSVFASNGSSRVSSSDFLAKIVITNIQKMKESINNCSRSDYELSSNNGYLLYLQNNTLMEDSSESMNIIYDLEGVLSHINIYLSDERRCKDDFLGEFRTRKEQLDDKITAKEEELSNEEDESTQIKLHDELEEMNRKYRYMIEEDEKRCEIINHYDSLIDDIYTIKSKFAKTIHDGITTGRYNENMEAYILIKSDEINTALKNIFHEDTNIYNCYDSDFFEDFEVEGVDFDDLEDIETDEEETDEDGFQRLQDNEEDVNNNNDDASSSDDESDDPSTEEEIKDANEEKEFVVKNNYELRDENTNLLKKLKQKDEEIEKLKALLRIYIK